MLGGGYDLIEYGGSSLMRGVVPVGEYRGGPSVCE